MDANLLKKNFMKNANVNVQGMYFPKLLNKVTLDCWNQSINSFGKKSLKRF